MSSFYTKIQKIATDNITKYGAPLVLEDANGAVLDNVMGIMGTINQVNMQNTLIANADGVISATVGNVIPTTEHYVRFLGELYKVIHVEAVNPAGTPLLYSIYVSK